MACGSVEFGVRPGGEDPVDSKGDQRGVTLVELLVGLSVLGLAAALVVLNAPPPRPPARGLAEEMAARLFAARDAALLNGAAHRLEIIEGDYRIVRQDGGDAWRVVYDWRAPAREDVSFSIVIDDPSADNTLALNGDGGVLFGADSNNRDDEPADYVVLDPLGPAAAFSAEFADRRTVWTVDYSVMGDIRVASR